MFSTVEIKQEYNSGDDRNQNVVVSQDSIDYSVFDNQNIQYAYHQLPQFWDQALQVQSSQYPKDFSHKNDGISRQDMTRANQSTPTISFNYINQHLQQQLQHQQENSTFTTNQQVTVDQSQVNQTNQNQSNVDDKMVESRALPGIIDNNELINSTLVGVQSSSSSIKRNTPGRPSKSKMTSDSGKKLKCQCEICFKEFGHKSNLFIHMRTHNGERPYKCKECNKCFTHSGNLSTHMRTHSGERPYTCQVCGKMFSHSGNLSTHLRTHSGIKPYKCSVCAKEFRHSGNLSIHERIHSGIKPFLCKVCGKDFYHSGNLTTHMKKHSLINSSEQCENNVLPTMNTEFICNDVNQVKDITRISITNSSDTNLHKELDEESKSS